MDSFFRYKIIIKQMQLFSFSLLKISSLST